MQDAEPNFPPYFKKFIFYSAAFHGVVWVVLFFLLSTNIQAPVETQVTWVQVGGPVSQDQTGGSATSEETGDKPSAPVKKEEVKPQPAKPSPPAKEKEVVIADKAKKSKPDQKKSDSTQTTQEKSPTKNSKPDPRIQNALAKINEDLKNEGGGGGGAGQSSGGPIGGAGGNSNGGGNSECGAYKARVKNIILGNWKRVTLASKPERPPKLSFRVTGAGQVTSVKWMQRSGDQVLDASAQRAVESSRTIPSPPANCQAALEESFVVQFGR